MAGGQLDFYGDKLLVTGNPDVDADVQLLAKLGLNGHRTTTTKTTTPSLPEAHSAAAGVARAAWPSWSASKRLVARCQLNALDGQISGQAVYLGQPCGFCVGKLLGDAPEVFGQGGRNPPRRYQRRSAHDGP